MSKSSQAFRTIREVADWLGVAAHVLRFWESKFPQIKPVKRAGGRRYYRPSDMELVGGIKVLLHDRGMTIRGVQKMIREDGVDTVAQLAPPLSPLLDDTVIDAGSVEAWSKDARAEDAGPILELEAEEVPAQLPLDLGAALGLADEEATAAEPAEEPAPAVPRAALLAHEPSDIGSMLSALDRAAKSTGEDTALADDLARALPALKALQTRLSHDISSADA